MWGLINLSLGNDSSILWYVPVILLIIIGVYLVARVGQKLSEKQIEQLNNFVQEKLR